MEAAASEDWIDLALPRPLEVALSVAYLGLVLFAAPAIRLRYGDGGGDKRSWQRALFVWNGALSVFSTVALAALTPEMAAAIGGGVRASYCSIEYARDATTAFWARAFHLSKAVELGDTLWLVARRRPIRFVHWYHHALVLLISWATSDRVAPWIRWGVWMNLLVHAPMYAYFAGAALLARRPPRALARALTLLQISQFVVGTLICIDVAAQLLFGADGCQAANRRLHIHSLLYASLLLVFSHLFYDSYLRRPKVATD